MDFKSYSQPLQEGANLTLAGTQKLYFRDTGLYIYSAADGKLSITADGTGADDLTIACTTTFSDSLLLSTTKKIQFYDTGLYIQASADGKLKIASDGSSTDDITLSGTITLDDDLITPTTKKIQFRDSGLYINSSADGKLVISSDGSGADDITLSGTVTGDANWLTTGTLTAAGATIGTGGSAFTKIKAGTVSITPPASLGAASISTSTAAISGLVANTSPIFVCAASASSASLIPIEAYCTTTGVLTVKFANPTAATAEASPTAQTLTYLQFTI